MWSSEANDWVDLGQFKGDPGTTYYTHIAWATNVVYENGSVTSVEGFVTTKTPNDTAYIWMGVLVNTSSGQDSSNAFSYKWSNTKGDDAVVVKLDPENVIITQSTEKDGNSYPLLELETRTINGESKKVYGKATIKIAKGNTEILSGFTIGTIETLHCNAAVVEIDGNSVVCITGVLTNDGEYYENGYVGIPVSYGGVTRTVRLNFYTNLLGKWKQTVENGIETSVATHLGNAIDPNGNITTSAQVGEYIRGWAENTQRLTRDSVNTVLYEQQIDCGDIDGKTVHLRRGKYHFYMRIDANTLPNGVYTWSFAGHSKDNEYKSEVEFDVIIGTEGNYEILVNDDVNSGSLFIEQIIITDITASVSELKQTADGFSQTVSNMNDRMSSIEHTAENISMGVNSGYRNYVANPLATDATVVTVTASSIVNDEVFGNVRQLTFSGNGELQLSCGFDDTHKAELTNSVVTVFAIVKPVSAGYAQLHFGTWSSNYTMPSILKANATDGVVTLVECLYENSAIDATTIKTGFQELGNGWYKIWSSFNAGQIFSEEKAWCGVNTLSGSTWQVYYTGIIKGFGCPSVDTIRQGIGLKRTGIDIENQLIRLQGDKVGFYSADGVQYIKVGVQPVTIYENGQQVTKNMPYFIFLAPDGVTEMYNLGYTGLSQLANNAVADSWEPVQFLCATLLGEPRGFHYPDSVNPMLVCDPNAWSHKGENGYFDGDWTDQNDISRNFAETRVIEIACWRFKEGYLIANGTRIYNIGGAAGPSPLNNKIFFTREANTQGYVGANDAQGWYFSGDKAIG